MVIATYNERENISSLVSGILSLKPEFNVLVVDDNSPDGTGKEVAGLVEREKRVDLLSRSGRKGYGSAILEGFRKALGMDADRIFTMDADHSHNPEALVALDQGLENYNLIIGSRYLGGIRILNWSLGRLALSLGANAYVRFLLRVPYSDCTSGFRGYRASTIRALIQNSIHSSGYAFLVEILNIAHRAGFSIGEVPIIYTERRAGRSKMSKASIREAVYRPWIMIARNLAKKTMK